MTMQKKTAPRALSDKAAALGALLADPTALSDAEVTAAVADGLAHRPATQAVAESLVVRLANLAQVTMHGRYMQDHFRQEAPSAHVDDDPRARREHYEVSPYNLPSANSVVTSVWRDPATDEPYVLLARRWAEWRNPASGLGTVAILPGGYMDPAPRAGAPDTIRHDRNLDDNAARELKEETTLDRPQDPRRFRQIQTRSDFYEISGARTHMIFADYLADFSGTATPPPAQGADDIAQAVWVPLRQLRRVSDGPAPAAGQYAVSRYAVQMGGDACIIYDPHAQAMEATLRAWRDQELTERYGLDSVAITQMARRLEAKNGRPEGDLLPPKPATELGPEAEAWHRRTRAVAERIVRTLDQAPLAPPLAVLPAKALHPATAPALRAA